MCAYMCMYGMININIINHFRVTAYCTAEGYYLGILMDFLRREHNVQSKYCTNYYYYVFFIIYNRIF